MTGRSAVGRGRAPSLLVVALSVVLVGSLVPLGGATPPFVVFGVGVDKMAHGLGYAVVGGLAAASGGTHRVTALVAVAVAVTAFGVGVEGVQSFVAWRTASVWDAVANAAGVAVGVAGWRVVARRRATEAVSANEA